MKVMPISNKNETTFQSSKRVLIKKGLAVLNKDIIRVTEKNHNANLHYIEKYTYDEEEKFLSILNILRGLVTGKFYAKGVQQLELVNFDFKKVIKLLAEQKKNTLLDLTEDNI